MKRGQGAFAVRSFLGRRTRRRFGVVACTVGAVVALAAPAGAARHGTKRHNSAKDKTGPS